MITCEYQDGRRPLEISTYSDKMLNWYFRSHWKRKLIEFFRIEVREIPPPDKIKSLVPGELPWWNR